MSEEKFKDYLDAKGLQISTKREYLSYYRLFQKHTQKHGLDQDSINLFIKTYTSNVTRAVLTNIFEFFDIRELRVPKRTGRVSRKKRRSISPLEINGLLDKLYKRRVKWGLVVELCYECALRRSEVLGVKVENFDFLRWAEEKNKGGCRLKIKGKGDKERIVIVPPELTQRIVLYISHKGIYSGKLFRRINFTIFQRLFKYSISGLSHDYTIHDLRRSKATRWHEEGKDLVQLKNRLGHESINTTQLYVNPDEEKELNVWEDEY